MKVRNRPAWQWPVLIVLALLLLVLLALVLVDVFDTRLFRAVVAPRIEERIGRDVEVDGVDLRWGLPTELRVENLRIANAEWAAADNMLVVPELLIELISLSGTPYAHVDARSPRIAIETSAEGMLNWNLDLQQATETQPSDDSQGDLPLTLRVEGGRVTYQDHGSEQSYAIPLELVTLQPAQEDQSAAAGQAIAATLQASYQDLPIDIDARLNPSPGQLRGDVAIRVGESNLAGAVEVDTSTTPLHLEAELQSDVMAVDQIMASLPADTQDTSPAVTIQAEVLQAIEAQVAIEIAELRLPGTTLADSSATLSIANGVLGLNTNTSLGTAALETTLQLDSTVPEPVLRLSAQLPQSDATALLEALGLPTTEGRLAIQLTAELHLQNGELMLASEPLLASLSIPEASVRYTTGADSAETLVLQARVSEPGAAPAIDVELSGFTAGMISASVSAPPLPLLAGGSYPIVARVMAPAAEADLQLDLRNVLASQNFVLDFSASGTELPAIPALGFSPPAVPAFELAAQLGRMGESWSLTNAELELGNSSATGALSWEPGQEPPYLEATVDASLIDLTTLPDLSKPLPEVDPASAVLEQAETVDLPGQGLLASALTAVDMDVSLTIEQLMLQQDFSLTDVDVQVELDEGRLQAEPLSFSTPAGNLHGSLTATASQQATNVDVSLAFEDLQPAGFAPEMAGIELLTEPLSGNLQLSFAERPAAKERTEDALLLPELGRVVLERAALDVRMPQSDTSLDIELTSDHAQDPAQDLLLEISGELRGTGVEGRVRGDSLQALRTAETPYQWMLELDAGGSEVAMDGTLVTDSGSPELAMQLSAQHPESGDLAQLLQPWAPETLPAFDVTGMLAWQQGRLSMEDLDAQIGDSDVSGSFSYSSGADVSNVEAMLHSMQLNLTELLGMQEEDEANAGDAPVDASTESTKVLPREPLNLAFLQQLNADIRYTADDVYLQETALGSLELDVSAQQGEILIEPFYLQVAGGGLRIEGDLDARNAALQGSVQAEARRLDLSELFRGSSLVKDDVGMLGGQAKFWMRGDSTAALLGSLDGGVLLMLSDGVIDPLLVEGAGLDIGEALLAAAGIGAAIPLNCAYVSAYAREGELSMERVVVDTEDSIFYLTGSVDLQQESVDLVLHNESKDLALLASNSPVGLRGTFSNPEVVVLTEELLLDGLQGLALGTLAAPAAALLAFVDTSDAEEVPPACRGWVETLRGAL